MTMMTARLRLSAALLFLALFTFGCAGVSPRPAPEFSVSVLTGELAGKTVSLSEFKGRPLVLNIGAVWCPHCLHEFPSFTAAHEKYKGDAAILMVFIKSEREAVDELIAEKKPAFMVGHDPSSSIGKAYGVKAIPVTLFIGADGMITDEYVGGISETRLDEKIMTLINRGNPGPAE